MSSDSSIAIVGATGVTGGFAFDAAEGAGLAPVAVGRNPAKLQSFLKLRGLGAERLRIADVHDEAALKRALAGVKIVISTVAPFSNNGFPIAKACAELGLGYVDPSGEGPFMQRLVNELEAVALRTGSTLCTGNGAAAFIGDVAMHWITDRHFDSSGALLYDIRDYKPSFGTAESYLKYIMPGGGALVRNGQVRFEPFAAFAGTVAGIQGLHSIVPDPFVISRYWPARNIDAYFRAPHSARLLVYWLAKFVLWRPLTNLLFRLPLKKWLAYDAEAGLRSTVTVLAEFRGAAGPARYRQLRGQAVYPLTGKLLVATAQAMLECQRRPAGVRAASEMFTSLAHALRLSGLEDVPLAAAAE